jgi:meso-butanediol dehydrogenase/(S,S)-butanediol dehydrogenase/diacetyl reductase
MRGRLEGRRVLITGTAGGQGAAAQAMFAREGARVEGCDVHAGASEATADALKAEGRDAHGSTVDLTDPEQAAAWVEDSASRLGGIDVLYNNAAGFGFSPFGDMTVELWRHVISVELDIVFNVTQPAWKHLVTSGSGSIINTSSYTAVRGFAPLGAAAHAAAKAGVLGLTNALAAEGAEHGIRANAILPGFVATPATDAAVDAAGRAYQLSKHLIQRAGTGEDIAAAALYLASQESTWVTGQHFSIDGGITAGFR